MAHSQDVRNAVRRSFVYERLPLEQAAEKHGVSYHTARNWKRLDKEEGDCWDKARVAGRMAAGGLGDLTTQVLEDFATLFQTTMEDIKKGDYSAMQKAEMLSRLSDAYTKTMKAAGGGDAKIAKLSIALEVLEELAKYIRAHYPRELENLAVVLEPFGKRVSEMYA